MTPLKKMNAESNDKSQDKNQNQWVADWVTLFIVPDMLPVWFLVAFDSVDIFSPRDILELPIEVLLASISLLLPRTLLNCWALPINDVLPPKSLPIIGGHCLICRFSITH